MCVNTHKYTHMYIHTCLHRNAQTHMHTYTHIHIHTHTHTNTPSAKQPLHFKICDLLQYPWISMLSEYSIIHSMLLQSNSILWNSFFISMCWKVSSVIRPSFPSLAPLLTHRWTPGAPLEPSPRTVRTIESQMPQEALQKLWHADPCLLGCIPDLGRHLRDFPLEKGSGKIYDSGQEPLAVAPTSRVGSTEESWVKGLVYFTLPVTKTNVLLWKWDSTNMSQTFRESRM